MEFYSQAGEDKYLFDSLFSNWKGPLTYLEVGALDGVRYSNTKFFHDTLGWKGVLIEPHPVLFKALEANRPNDQLFNDLVSSTTTELEYQYFEQPNLAAVSGITETLTDQNLARFFRSDEDWLRKAAAAGLKTRMMTPVTLDSIISESSISEFGFMSIDVEGHELSLLQSFSFQQRVGAFLVESGPDNSAIGDLLAANGYSFSCNVAHNRLFVSAELN